MNCIYESGNHFGHIDISHLDYSCLISMRIVKPSTWIKYIGLARDWIVEQMLHDSNKMFLLPMSLQIDNAYEMRRFNHKNIVMSTNSSSSSSLLQFHKLSFRVSYSLLSVQDSVFTGSYVITNLSNGNLMATAISKDVLINSKNHQISQPVLLDPSISLSLPIDIPEIRKSNEACQLNQPRSNSKVFFGKYPITCIGLGRNGMATPGFFIDMCFNCINDAVCSNFSLVFKDTICWYTPASIFASYIGKAFIGDEVDVTMWNDVTAPYKFNIKFLNSKTTELLCQCIITFYDSLRRDSHL